MNENILEVKNLCTYFYMDSGVVKAVDGLDFELRKNSTLGIVGESGSGKSVTSLSIMGLLKGTTGKVVDGKIIFDGQDILPLSEEERRKIRGNQIAMIFQEPMTSLNPVMKIGRQIDEVMILHQGLDKTEARKRTFDSNRTSAGRKFGR